MVLLFANPQKLYKLRWVRQSSLSLARTGHSLHFKQHLMCTYVQSLGVFINILVLTLGHKVKFHYSYCFNFGKEKKNRSKCVSFWVNGLPFPFAALVIAEASTEMRPPPMSMHDYNGPYSPRRSKHVVWKRDKLSCVTPLSCWHCLLLQHYRA